MSSGPASDDEQWTLRVDAGVVRLGWVPGLTIDREIARGAMKAVDELNAGRERPLCVEIGGAYIDRGARGVFAERCSASRIALVGRSAVDRVAANFALRVGTQPVPTRFFTSTESALDWLRGGRDV